MSLLSGDKQQERLRTGYLDFSLQNHLTMESSIRSLRFSYLKEIMPTNPASFTVLLNFSIQNVMTVQKITVKPKKRRKATKKKPQELMNYILQLSAQYLKQGHLAQKTTDALATKTKKTWTVSGKYHCFQCSPSNLLLFPWRKINLPHTSLHTVYP